MGEDVLCREARARIENVQQVRDGGEEVGRMGQEGPEKGLLTLEGPSAYELMRHSEFVVLAAIAVCAELCGEMGNEIAALVDAVIVEATPKDRREKTDDPCLVASIACSQEQLRCPFRQRLQCLEERDLDVFRPGRA